MKGDINMYISNHDNQAKLGYIDKSDVDYESKFAFDEKSKQFIWSMDCGKKYINDRY